MVKNRKIKLSLVFGIFLFSLLALKAYAYFTVPWSPRIDEWTRVVYLSKFAITNSTIEIVKYLMLIAMTVFILLKINVKM